MVLIRAALLGTLRAFTEIFPFSQKAHLLLLEWIFHYQKTYRAYDIMLDAGILLAIYVYYVRDINQILRQLPVLFKAPFSRNRANLFLENRHALLFSLILVSCVTTAISRFIVLDSGMELASHREAVGLFWVIMGMLILMTRRFSAGQRVVYEMNHQDAFLIGLVQGLAVFPGISRAGITMALAMFLGVERKEAARYSFLLVVPYFISAIFWKYVHGANFHQSDQTALCVSFLTALVMGVVALAGLNRILENRKYYLCSVYCFALGILTIIFTVFPGLGL